MNRKDRYLDRLHEVPVLRGLPRAQLETVARRAETVPVAAEQVIVREGTPGEELFVVVAGALRVTRGGRPVADLGPGDVFGELALLAPAPRDATVTATSPGELLVVHVRHLAPLLEDVPLLARRVSAGLASRLRAADEHVVGG